MYAIFYNNKALIFPGIDESQIDISATSPQSDAYETEVFSKFLSNWLTHSPITDTYIDHIAIETLSSALLNTFRIAPAAGGVVVSGKRVVYIQRNGIPDLPKGHIESGETPENAALREVREETGIEALQIVKDLPTSWHCYDWHGEWRLKPTYWFAMQCFGDFILKPQQEENIESVQLLYKKDLDYFFCNTFRSIRETLEKDIRALLA